MCVVQLTPCINHELYIETAAAAVYHCCTSPRLYLGRAPFRFWSGNLVLRGRGIQKPFAASRETTFDFRYVEVSLSAHLDLGLRKFPIANRLNDLIAGGGFMTTRV